MSDGVANNAKSKTRGKSSSPTATTTSTNASSKKTVTTKDLEQRMMKYEDDLTSLSSANTGLVNIVKSVYTLINTVFKENEQLSDEVNNLNTKLVAMEYEGTSIAANVLKCNMRKGMIEDQVLSLMDVFLRGNEDFVAGLMESNQHLTNAVSCISGVISGNGNGVDDGNGNSKENGIRYPSELIASMVSSVRDLETILVDTKSQAHRNQLHFLSVNKEKEESLVKLIATENELKEFKKEKQTRKSRDNLELKSRRIAHEVLIEEHREVSSGLRRLLMNLQDELADDNLDDEGFIPSPTSKKPDIVNHYTNRGGRGNGKTGNGKWAKVTGSVDVVSNSNGNVDSGPIRVEKLINSPNKQSSTQKNTSASPSPWSLRRGIMSVSLTSEMSRDMNSDKGVHLPIPKRSKERSDYVTPGALETASVVSEDT